MPELPEVETVCRTLAPKITGRSFTGVTVNMPKIVRDPDPEEFPRLIEGRKVQGIERRGKYIVISLNGDLTLLVHLRMTGQLIYCEPQREQAKHTHLIFTLDNGNELRYIDPRQFGRIYLLTRDKLNLLAPLQTLGVEPLGPVFKKEYLRRELRTRRTRIKPLLLDQSFLAGVGNIYADEALHRAKINPERLANTLTAREISHLYQAIRDVLEEGIAHRGTSVRDYVDGSGEKGGFQEHLRVYGRENEPCQVCGKAIYRKRVAGRSSYFCPKCQKA